MTGQLTEAIRATLISPNETDSNLEPANVVDGLYAIARALNRIAEAIENGPDCSPFAGLDRIAGAIESHAESLDHVAREVGIVANVLEIGK